MPGAAWCGVLLFGFGLARAGEVVESGALQFTELGCLLGLPYDCRDDLYRIDYVVGLVWWLLLCLAVGLTRLGGSAHPRRGLVLSKRCNKE